MEEAENKICENCKREIPLANFTIHAVHCARNIRVCPVCKEPVPAPDLQRHHDDMHKLGGSPCPFALPPPPISPTVPCKQCGEGVCGTDLEDHVRDSCELTMQTCRYCSLELRRRELPPHERYCGARTELCECGEWVMTKYRALHHDTNHGFIRLDDDPVPIQSIKTSSAKTKIAADKTANQPNGLKNVNRSQPRDVPRGSNPAGPSGHSNGVHVPPDTGANVPSVPLVPLVPLAGTSQGNTSNRSTRVESSSVNGNGAIPRVKRTEGGPAGSEGADKTRNSSSRGSMKKRPAPPPPAAPGPARAALQRQQLEQEARRQRNSDNLARGLPPELTPAEKIERLRKMDALHNRETDDQAWRSRLQGRLWASALPPAGQRLGGPEMDEVREDLRNLKPMTPEEFDDRYRNIRAEPDRFSQIKTSLRELRRGLKEVTAPYNSNSTGDTNRNRHDEEAPCEFCGTSVLLEDLVLHQTGCRPDLAQYRGPKRSPGRSPAPPAEPPAPLIPCEFCARPLPVHLVCHHQERCGRERNILFPD